MLGIIYLLQVQYRNAKGGKSQFPVVLGSPLAGWLVLVARAHTQDNTKIIIYNKGVLLSRSSAKLSLHNFSLAQALSALREARQF